MSANPQNNYLSTTNPCKVCAPLGACLAIKGIEKAMTILHGSQGCATYIRRYLISHFREPFDIASSSFDETAAVFGGKDNLGKAIANVEGQYHPELIAVATSCLSETIGDDIFSYCREFNKNSGARLVPVPTPSFSGAQLKGFYLAVFSIVKTLAGNEEKRQRVNLFPSMYSPADLRHLKQITESFGLDAMILPDYSETLDGGIWGEYLPVPPGGSPINTIESSGAADLSIGFSPFIDEELSAGIYLEKQFKVPNKTLYPPFGIESTDAFLEELSRLSGLPVPSNLKDERARLIDAYADCHKYVFGKKAAVYGDADFTAGMAIFLSEIGIRPIVFPGGPAFPNYAEKLETRTKDAVIIGGDPDFARIEEFLADCPADLLIGNSKGYKTARKTETPLVRCGFPIHDRVGGPRSLHIGYAGAQALLDNIVNSLLAAKQEESGFGFFYQ